MSVATPSVAVRRPTTAPLCLASAPARWLGKSRVLQWAHLARGSTGSRHRHVNQGRTHAILHRPIGESGVPEPDYIGVTGVEQGVIVPLRRARSHPGTTSPHVSVTLRSTFV